MPATSNPPNDTNTTLQNIKDTIAVYQAERGWDKLDPRDLAISITIEAAELMEHFLWMENAESHIGKFDAATRHAIGEEMADVACLLLAMSNATSIDLSEAISGKLVKNAVKYPVERYRSRYRIGKEATH